MIRKVLLLLLVCVAVFTAGAATADDKKTSYIRQTFENHLYDEDHLFSDKERNEYNNIHAALDGSKKSNKDLIKKEKSALEEVYSRRIVDEVGQFGYDLFGSIKQGENINEDVAVNTLPSGAVQDDYVLGTGDELDIVFFGQRNDRKTYKVDTQGMVVVDEFPPVNASGRTIEQVRKMLEDISLQTPNTNIYVSLSKVRQIGVLVVGHVKKPGRQQVTVFHTVLDVLMNAGGVEKTGSLRQIKLVRGGRSTIIDIYGLLLHGATNMDLNLHDGDRIVVPAIGPTVAIAGEVKRAGIYEILPDIRGMFNQAKQRSELLTLNDMLSLGGGTLTPGKTRYLRLDITESGHEMLDDIEDPFVPIFGDGAILMVARGEDKRSDSIELVGHTRRPGLYALQQTPSLSALLSSEDVLGGTYLSADRGGGALE